MIISGYQGIGKSTLSGKNNCIDLESGNFWNNGERPDNWYIYYCNIANHLSAQGYTVFVASHQAVRERLAKYSKENCIVIIPDITLKKEWVNKLYQRWQNTHLEKDFKAYANAKDCFEKNIKEIESGALPVFKIDSMDYKLEDIVSNIKNNLFNKDDFESER